MTPSQRAVYSIFDGEPHPEYLPEDYENYSLESKNYSHVQMKEIADNILNNLSKWKSAKTIHFVGSDLYMAIFDHVERLQVLENLSLLSVVVENSSYHTFNPADILTKVPQLKRFEIEAGNGVSFDDLKAAYDGKAIPSGYIRVPDKDVKGNESKLVFEKALEN